MKQTICIMNDSFPPQIDGVANTAANYASIIERDLGHSIVVTPEFPEKDDSVFPFPVIRYPSLDARWFIGYMAGIPFSPTVAKQLRKENTAVMHCHCPSASLVLARELRNSIDVPVVFTYHTKYDVDIAKALKSDLLTDGAIRIMIENISACDEVWTVSRGAGENLKSLGFEGDYIVMENGVDMPLGRASEGSIASAAEGYDLPREVPVFLFVGRMMWYKGIRIILDALEGLKQQGVDFRMIFIGSGADLEEIRSYSDSLKLQDRCIFTGAIRDREILKAWYSRADLFLFPSTYDTNGLVVREAAACSLASVLVEGSCAAEGVAPDRNGFLISESPASLAVMLYRLCQKPEAMKRAGELAAKELYISWDTAVTKAYERYQTVIDYHRSGKYQKRRKLSDHLLNRQGELMSALSRIPKPEELLDRYL